MSRLVDNAIKTSENFRRREMPTLTIITHSYGTYDPATDTLPDTQFETDVRVTKQSVSESEMGDTEIRMGDTKLLIREELIKQLDVSNGVEVELNGETMEIIHGYIDSSESLRILYVR